MPFSFPVFPGTRLIPVHALAVVPPLAPRFRIYFYLGENAALFWTPLPSI